MFSCWEGSPIHFNKNNTIVSVYTIATSVNTGLKIRTDRYFIVLHVYFNLILLVLMIFFFVLMAFKIHFYYIYFKFVSCHGGPA